MFLTWWMIGILAIWWIVSVHFIGKAVYVTIGIDAAVDHLAAEGLIVKTDKNTLIGLCNQELLEKHNESD